MLLNNSSSVHVYFYYCFLISWFAALIIINAENIFFWLTCCLNCDKPQNYCKETNYNIYITLQGCITFIISARKVIYNVQKNIYISNKCVFFTFYSSVNPKKLNVSWFTQKYETAWLYSTLIIIRNVSWAEYYYDFWRLCDTEDWRVMML